jgi:hypothetical protein
VTITPLRVKKPKAPKKTLYCKKKISATSNSSPIGHVDTTTFPFLKLPGEIRNLIYAYTLVDDDHSLRFEADVSKRDGRCIVKRLYRARPGPPDRDDLPNQQKGSITKPCTSYKRFDSFRKFELQMSFAINLFQICKQINGEAASIFYGNNIFTFEAVSHLYAFLIHFQQRLPLIRKLGVASNLTHPDHYLGPASIVRNTLSSIFLPLAAAVNLEALYLNVSVLQSLSGRGAIAAESLYRDAHVWMNALAVKKGNKLAVLNVLKMPPISTKPLYSPKWSVSKLGQEEFRLVLAAKLTAAGR